MKLIELCTNFLFIFLLGRSFSLCRSLGKLIFSGRFHKYDQNSRSIRKGNTLSQIPCIAAPLLTLTTVQLNNTSSHSFQKHGTTDIERGIHHLEIAFQQCRFIQSDLRNPL